MAPTHYALRLQASLMTEVKKVVAEEGTTINQFINSARRGPTCRRRSRC